MGMRVNRAKRNKKQLYDMLFYIGLIILPLLQFAIFYVGINASSFALAFQPGAFKTALAKVGIIDYLDAVGNALASKDGFWLSGMKYSFLVYVLGQLINTPLVIAVSYFIYKKSSMGGWMKVVLYAPTILSTMVHTLVYKYTCEFLLPELFGAPDNLLDTTSSYAFVTVYMYTIWGGFGASMLLYTNAMDSIPQAVTEAAQIDGVTFFGEFIHITFPMIYGTWKTLFIVNLASILMNQFSLVELYGLTDIKFATVGYYLYKETLKASMPDYPYLAALGLLFSAVAIPITLLGRYITDKLDPMEN